MAALPPNQFNNIIRLVRRGSAEQVAQIRQITFDTLKRLGAPREAERAVAKTPAGSDQVDMGSIVSWMQNVSADDWDSIRQVIAIDATAVDRS